MFNIKAIKELKRPKTEYIGGRIDETVRQDFIVWCDDQGVSVSAALCELIGQFLTQIKKSEKNI